MTCAVLEREVLLNYFTKRARLEFIARQVLSTDASPKATGAWLANRLAGGIEFSKIDSPGCGLEGAYVGTNAKLLSRWGLAQRQRVVQSIIH
jgi:hypothetical protein